MIAANRATAPEKEQFKGTVRIFIVKINSCFKYTSIQSHSVSSRIVPFLFINQ